MPEEHVERFIEWYEGLGVSCFIILHFDEDNDQHKNNDGNRKGVPPALLASSASRAGRVISHGVSVSAAAGGGGGSAAGAGALQGLLEAHDYLVRAQFPAYRWCLAVDLESFSRGQVSCTVISSSKKVRCQQ